MADVYLTAFLRRYAGLDFEFGRLDCLLFIADWVAERRGIDPAAALRGSYRGWFGAARIIYEAGGMARLVDRCVMPLGIARTAEPARGDIAVVAASEGERGAIVLGATVARHGPRFVKVERLPIIAAWAL